MVNCGQPPAGTSGNPISSGLHSRLRRHGSPMQGGLRSFLERHIQFDTSAIKRLTFSKIRADLFPVLPVRGRFDLDEKKKMAEEYIAAMMKPTDPL